MFYLARDNNILFCSGVGSISSQVSCGGLHCGHHDASHQTASEDPGEDEARPEVESPDCGGEGGPSQPGQTPLAQLDSLETPQDIHSRGGRGRPVVGGRGGEEDQRQEGGGQAEEGSQGVQHQELAGHTGQVEDGGQEEGGEDQAGQYVGQTVHAEEHPAAAHQHHPHTAGQTVERLDLVRR